VGAPAFFLIPVFPFPQRLESLLTLESRRDGVAFRVVDTAKPQPDLRSRPCPPKDEERHSATGAEPGG
jgi:hypothetical protein